MIETLRTPEDRFEKIPDFAYAPHGTDVPDGDDGMLRIVHVEAGPSSAAPILCLHGQPTWSFLYRKMLPVFAAAGQRAIAPDLVGFGRSDKPVRREDYSYARHVAWLRAWLEALDLRHVTLVCQDWGGLIGLRLVAECPERFARVVAANTGLPDGMIPESACAALRKLRDELPVVGVHELGERFRAKEGPPGFLYWQKFCAETPEFEISQVVRSAGGRDLPPEVLAAYDAPFPDERYKAGARQFPTLVPIFADDPAIPDQRRAWQALRRLEKPFLTAFSDRDPVTRGGEKRLQEEIPGAEGQPHTTIRGAGHFLQEDAGEELARVVLDFVAATT